MWPFGKKKPVDVYQIHELYVKAPEASGSPLSVKLKLQFTKNTSSRIEIVRGWIADAELAKACGESGERLPLSSVFFDEGGVALTRPRENSSLCPLAWQGALLEGVHPKALAGRLEAGDFDIVFATAEGEEFGCKVAKKLVGQNIKHKYTEEGVS